MTSVAVVSAGCKSILDIGRTKEVLETKTSLTMRQQSHYDLMRLDCNEPVTFCFFEDVFENIIRKRMAPYHNSDVFCSITGRTDFQNVSLNNRVLIVPEKSTLSLNKDMESFVRSAEQDGVHVIYIHYRLDRGSLLFLRSLICETWNLKYQNGFCDVNNSLDYHRKEYESDSVL